MPAEVGSELPWLPVILRGCRRTSCYDQPARVHTHTHTHTHTHRHTQTHESVHDVGSLGLQEKRGFRSI